MLPTSGYFRGIPCPDHEKNMCRRPYCHFDHCLRKGKIKTPAPVSSSSKPDTEGTTVTGEESSNASCSTEHCEEEDSEQQADTGGEGRSGTEGVQSDILQQLVSEAVKKVLAENPGLASSVDTSEVMKSINTSALVAEAAALANDQSAAGKKKVYLRPPGTPRYNPTPIRVLNKRKVSTEDPAPDSSNVISYTPTPISELAVGASATQTQHGNKDAVDSEATDFSSDEDDVDVDQRRCDFDLLEEVLAEQSQNNKVKVKKKRVKALGKLKYNLSNLDKKVDRSSMISDAKHLPDPENIKGKEQDKVPGTELPAQDSYFLPPSPVFTSSSGGSEVYNSVVYTKSSCKFMEVEPAQNDVNSEQLVQNAENASPDKDNPHSVSKSESSADKTENRVLLEGKPLGTEKKTISLENKQTGPESKQTKSKGHSHLPQVLHTLGAPKLSRLNVRSWTPQSQSGSLEAKKGGCALDEMLQLLDGSNEPEKNKDKRMPSNVKERVVKNKKYKVDLNKEIESLTNISSTRDSTVNEESEVSLKEKGKNKDADIADTSQLDDKENVEKQKKDDFDNEHASLPEKEKRNASSDASSDESDDDDSSIVDGSSDKEKLRERHKKKRKRRYRSSSESESRHPRKKRKKNRKHRRRHSRGKKRKRHRQSTSSSEDSEDDTADSEADTDAGDGSDDKDEGDKSPKHKKRRKYKHRKKSKYKKKKSKHKKKRSKSYSTGSSRSSSRSRSVSTSRHSSISSEGSDRVSRSKAKSRSRDSSKESSDSRSSSRENRKKSKKRKRKSSSKERSNSSKRERESEERKSSSPEKSTKDRKHSISKENGESTKKGRRESESRERKESTSKEKKSRSTSKERRESKEKRERRDSHKDGSSKTSTVEEANSLEKKSKQRSASRDKDKTSSTDPRLRRDKDKEGKKGEGRSRSISQDSHSREKDRSQEKLKDSPVSIPMPMDPSDIKKEEEEDVIEVDLSRVKVEKADDDDSSRTSLLSENLPKNSVSRDGESKVNVHTGSYKSATSRGGNTEMDDFKASQEQCKSKIEARISRRKNSTESLSDKSSNSRHSTDSRHSDSETLTENRRTGDSGFVEEKDGTEPSSPEPMPRKLSMFDMVAASNVPKQKSLTEISMFDTVAAMTGGKPKAVRHKHRSSGSVDSSNLDTENDKQANSGNNYTIKEKGSLGNSGSVNQQFNTSSSKTHSKHPTSNKHKSKHSSSSSSSKHSSSDISNKHNSSGSNNKRSSSKDSSSHKHSSSSSKHSSSSRHSGSHKHSSKTSRNEKKHDSRKHQKGIEHSTPKGVRPLTTAGHTPLAKSALDTTSSGVSDRDTFDCDTGGDSPLPDLSVLDEIPHDDWEQIINSSNTPESLVPEQPESDSDLDDLDHDDAGVLEECMRMFNEFQPDPDAHDSQISIKKLKAQAREDEGSGPPSARHRVARTSGTGNLIPRKPSAQKHRMTPIQKMMERYNELKEKNAELMKRLSHPQESRGHSATTSTHGSAGSTPTTSCTQLSSPQLPGKKRRISHVPNVSSLLNAREKIKSLPPSDSRKLLSPKVAKASGVIPASTTAQTLSKGGKRVAHTPSNEVLVRPIIPAEFGSKVPQNIRQRYLNTLIDECLKFTSKKEAFSIGVAEERVCYQRASSRMVYLSLAVNAVKRLRSQQTVGEAAQELLDADPELCEGLQEEHRPPSPQPSTSSGSSALSKTPGKSHPINPNHVKLSHFTVLSGGGQKGSWSIEKTKKSSSSTSGKLNDDELYKLLAKYILTEEQLGENGYPFPDPEEKGKAIVKTVNRRKKISPSSTERYCDRCSSLFIVDKWGFPVTTTSCAYHWGRSYKRRTYVGFESRYSCCDGDLQTGGCCLATTHVSQNYDPKKLHGYVRTLPKYKGTSNPGIYALDCEMSYTTSGCELTRVTVINTSGNVVYEQLVKPENPIIDYNTRFSGITEKDMEDVRTSIIDVQASLLARFSDKTILIGHSLESDLHALKIIHDTVVDTSVVFPHKMGPPSKRALRNLASEYLKRIIQNDVSGHDSAEDAIACMDLMHWKIKEDLKGLR